MVGAPAARVRRAGVVVVRRDSGRERRGRVVVQDQRLAGELREVDDHVGPLGRRQEQRVLVDVPDVEAGRVGDPRGRLLAVDDGRGRQEAALAADLDPVGTRGRGALDRGRDDVRGRSAPRPASVGFSATSVAPMSPACWAGAGVRLADVPLEVQEAVVGRVQHAEAVRLRLQRHLRICDAVDDRRVVELLHADRDVRRAGDQLRLAERVGLVLSTSPGRRACRPGRSTGCRWVRTAVVARGPEPRAVHPATVGAHAADGSPGFCAGMYTWWYQRLPLPPQRLSSRIPASGSCCG